MGKVCIDGNGHDMWVNHSGHIECTIRDDSFTYHEVKIEDYSGGFIVRFANGVAWEGEYKDYRGYDGDATMWVLGEDDEEVKDEEALYWVLAALQWANED